MSKASANKIFQRATGEKVLAKEEKDPLHFASGWDKTSTKPVCSISSIKDNTR
jgi:hypothetical protein